MRKRIRELAEGRVDCAKPVVEFSVERIELQIPEGEDYKGEFTVISENHVPVRGMVYSSNPRMECKTLGFEGEEIRIQYLFHSAGLVEGNIQKGEFTVVCSQGEYSLSFVVMISRQYADSQNGIIRNLEAFTELAQTNWQEAKQIFYSPFFSKIFGTEEEKERLIYNGIANGRKTDTGMEEFLVACGRKNPVTVTAAQTEFTFSQVTEKSIQELTLFKDTWGYIELEFTSDADFLEVPKRRIGAEDFLGSQTTVNFYLNPLKMHAGRNYGTLVFGNIRQEIRIPVCAMLHGEKTSENPRIREIQKFCARLLEEYIAYRLRKTVTGKWAAETLKILDDLIVREPGNVWYRLFKAQTFWMNRQKQEAEWILDEFKRKWEDKRCPQWGYYLYICTLMEQDEAGINRLTQEIEQIYLEHQENLILFWCLLFLREDYVQNRYQKLKALEGRIMGGTDSPILYVEAYSLFVAEPYLLSRFGAFEEKILNWAQKQGVLTKALAEQVISAFSGRYIFKERTLLLLEACYKLLDDERILKVICEYLIRSQIYGRRYFSWYALGVEKKLRITGLYEAYLMSMDVRSVQNVPRIIQMYFKYNNQLNYRLKAVLYVNIIASKKEYPNVYEQHYTGMENFAYEQMALMHMDDNLAVVYVDVLSHGIHFPEVSEAAANILFIHRLTCPDPHAAKVVVLQDVLDSPCTVSILNGKAYFPLYSDRYAVFVEDRYGNRFSSGIPYQLEKMMYPGRYLRSCMQKSPRQLPLLLHYFSNRRAQEIFEEKDLGYFRAVMSCSEVSARYKALLFPKMFCLLYILDLTEEMKQELKKVDFSCMQPKSRGCIMEMCIEKQLFAQAYRIAETYGLETVPAALRVRLLNDRIQALEYAEDEMLLKYCADTFFIGKYNDVMLEYLCRYYQGQTKDMESIFKCAQNFYINTQELAERILVQMMYTDGFVDGVDVVYKSYETAGSPLLKKAYLTFFCYHSFVGGMLLSEEFYRTLRFFWKDGYEIDGVCELELLKYYALHPAVLEQEEQIADDLLKKYILQGIYFAFYRDLGTNLVQKYQLYDKTFIEYHTTKHCRVKLHYAYVGRAEHASDRLAIGESTNSADGEYITEDMAEVYDGIYVKKVILFLDESIGYYISEERNGREEVTESGLLSSKPVQTGMAESRYGRLNAIIRQKAEGNTEGVYTKMLEYEQLDNTVDRLFTIV